MKIFIGTVIGKKMAKTATVAVERTVIHPLYQKRFKRVRKYPVHDELETQVGQTVKFITCRPYSKTKKWKVTEIVIRKEGKKTKKEIKK